MPDLLTHVLIAYMLGRGLVCHSDQLSEYHIPVLMTGSILPDLSKIRLVVGELVTDLFGVQFTWVAIHRIGAVLALAGVGTLLFDSERRRSVFGLLVGGATIHLVLDTGIKRANGLAPPYLYPFTWWQPPAGGFYLSSDLWPVTTAVILATVVWMWHRYVLQSERFSEPN